ncbi:MAG: twin-arginine translocation signal domain-containing protein, partial [Myxococcota bacterium]|nr:twin-arginine translocation signal domain-containing protein [Myxococcota bacterium]
MDGKHETLTRRRFLARSAAGVALAGAAGPTALSGLAHAAEGALATGAPVTPQSMDEWLGGIHWLDYVPDRVALTFDDGPRPRTTPRVL